jgi:hypothetical protein
LGAAESVALVIAPLKGTTNVVFTGELVQAEHRGNDRVMAEGIDMGVAFVAGQERDQNAAEDPGLLGGRCCSSQ